MDNISNRLTRCMVILSVIFLVSHISLDIAFGKIYGPVSIEPYDEESTKKINRGMSDFIEQKDKLAKDLSILVNAITAYDTNPNQQNDAAARESIGNTIYSSAKTINKIVNATETVLPELRKCRTHLIKAVSNIENSGGNSALTGVVLRKHRDEIKGMEGFISSLDDANRVMRKIGNDLYTLAKLFYESENLSQTLGQIYGTGRPGEVCESIGDTMKSLKEVAGNVARFMTEDKTRTFGDEYEKGHEYLYRIIDEMDLE